MRTQSKGKGFKNLLLRDECKLKQVIAKQHLLTTAQIFKKTRIDGVKKDKSPWQPLLAKSNIVKRQNLAKKYLKIEFSKVNFLLVTFDGPDGWAKGWIIFNSDVSVAKRKQQRDDSGISK